MAVELREAIREVRDTFLTEPVSPRVATPRDINLHYCRYVAETVANDVAGAADVEILEDGGRGFVHTWIACDGRHYDAECIDGVADYRDLPFFKRHPESAIHVEPASTDPSRVRNRGRRPLYPPMFDPVRSHGQRSDRRGYRRLATAGSVLGLGLLILGAMGTWSVH